MHVAPAVVSFLSKFTQMRVELLLIDRSINLVEEGIDVAIRIGHLPDLSLIAKPVGEITEVVCANPGYLKQVKTLKTPQELTGLNCIHFSTLNSNNAWPFRINNKKVIVRITSTFIKLKGSKFINVLCCLIQERA